MRSQEDHSTHYIALIHEELMHIERRRPDVATVEEIIRIVVRHGQGHHAEVVPQEDPRTPDTRIRGETKFSLLLVHAGFCGFGVQGSPHRNLFYLPIKKCTWIQARDIIYSAKAKVARFVLYLMM